MPDLYGIVENWKSNVKLMPDASWGDMYNYLLNPPSEYTHDNLKAYKYHWKLSTFLCTTMFKTFFIMELQKNLNFAVSKQRHKNIYLNIFIKSLF